MAENTAKPQTEKETPERKHEPTDVSLKGIAIFLLIMLVFAIVMHAVLWWWLQGMSPAPAQLDEVTRWRPMPRAQPEVRREFPQLQLSPPRDLKAYLARESQWLNRYGWLNRTAGVVRIPIDRAMEIVAQRGLPDWGATNRARSGISPLELQHQRAKQPATQDQR